jgi:tryptophan synthase, alpha subunit
MSNIKEAFTKKAFIAFITCGDPDLSTTEEIAVIMAKNGVDMIELGIPFSDPTAEGPVIQNANIRALQNGVTTDKIFDMVKRIRMRTQIPLAFMTYANVVYSYGIEKFIKKAATLGIDGLILPDVPYEEKEEFCCACRQNKIDFISLIAPTSQDRITTITKEASGFIYCVSSLGVTGTRDNIETNLDSIIKIVRKNTNIPCAIGFGISTPEQAKYFAHFADGIIIGSAIIKIIEQHGQDCLHPLQEYILNIKNAIRSGV